MQAVAVQPDGKIIIGGGFTAFTGVTRRGVARANPNGTLDTTFETGTGTFEGRVNDVAVDSGGKILIGGNFNNYNGVAIDRIARLNPNGSLDTTFGAGTETEGDVHAIAMQPDGKVVIVGQLIMYNGVARTVSHALMRMAHWARRSIRAWGPSIYWPAPRQSDGKMIIGGNFTSYNGTARNRIARLNTDGSLDTTSSPPLSPRCRRRRIPR